MSHSTWAHAASEVKGLLFALAVLAAMNRASDPYWVTKTIAATALYFAAHTASRVMRMKAGEELP